MRIAILGCGPAGLMAAHAAKRVLRGFNEEIDLDILSRRRKSPLYGAQYLHKPIPNVDCGDSRTVEYLLRGSADDYRRKVYGRLWDGTVSAEDLDYNHRAWDIRAAYDELWVMYEHNIRDTEIDPAGVKFLVDQYDLVINSIPRDVICYAGHTFGFTTITAAGDAPELGVNLERSGYRCLEDTIICNGEENPSWYRMSRVFGHTTIEWPATVGRVPINTAATVRKPLHHNCDCHPGVVHVGRYGTWEKGVLSHTAYFNTLETIERRLSSAAGQETLW